jgi:DNA-binding NarL/FixJ family response regulator
VITTVIADDHYLVREGTRRLLEASTEVEVLATVEDGDQLEQAVSRLKPDAVVVDIRMPPTHQMEGIEAAHRIRAEAPTVGVVVLSQHANSMYAFELFKEGTTGLAYLLKDRVADLDELLRALREVVSGGSVIDPIVVEELMNRPTSVSASLLDTLTPREREVLGAMAQGRSNSGIAESLFISGSAVEKHITSIFEKIGLPAGEADTHRRVAAVLAFLKSQEIKR